MSPFRPHGEIAQWRIVYQRFQRAAVGATVTYNELAEALGVDAKGDRHRIQAAARRASKRLLEVDSRAVEVDPDVGYIVAPAQRQIPMAGKQIERATHHLDRGRDLVTYVRLDELNDQSRAIVQAMGSAFAQVAEWARQVGQRVDAHEDRLTDLEAEMRRLREERGD